MMTRNLVLEVETLGRHLQGRANGPVSNLGVGHSPTEAEVTERRARLMRASAHLLSSLRRKAMRATTREKMRALARALWRIDSNLGSAVLHPNGAASWQWPTERS